MGRIRRYPPDQEPRIRQAATRVLLVDDDPRAVQRYREALTSFGAIVSSAASVRAAVDELERGSFDLVLVDYLLHGFHGPTGLEVAAAARARTVPMYVLALHPRHVPREAATAVGVNGILDKAFLGRDDLWQLLLDVQLGKEIASIPACWSTRTARYQT